MTDPSERALVPFVSVENMMRLVHEIGLEMLYNEHGELGFCVHVGGGLGRTPMVGPVIREFLPEKDLLTYLEAILRVYNRYGRRDNKYKARIKILVKALTPEGFAEKVEAEWSQTKNSPTRLTQDAVDHIKSHFTEPGYADLQDNPDELVSARADSRTNTRIPRASPPRSNFRVA